MQLQWIQNLPRPWQEVLSAGWKGTYVLFVAFTVESYIEGHFLTSVDSVTVRFQDKLKLKMYCGRHSNLCKLCK